MGDDWAAIQAWATIFTEPTKLAETVGKNWLLHKRTIKEDITKMETDWTAKSYFDSGIDAAMALTEAVGPISSFDLLSAGGYVGDFPIPLPSMDHLKMMLENMFKRLVELNELYELRNCMNLSEEALGLALKAYKKFAKEDIFGGFAVLAELSAVLFDDFEQCTASKEDVELFLSWSKVFLGFKPLTEATTAQMHLHYQEIAYRTDIARYYFMLALDPKATDDTFKAFGWSLGETAYWALGSMKPRPPFDGPQTV